MLVIVPLALGTAAVILARRGQRGPKKDEKVDDDERVLPHAGSQQMEKTGADPERGLSEWVGELGRLSGEFIAKFRQAVAEHEAELEQRRSKTKVGTNAAI